MYTLKTPKVDTMLLYLQKGETMTKFTKEERLEIGKRIYNNEISVYDAATEYDINWYTARDYMREYRSLQSLPPMKRGPRQVKKSSSPKASYSDLESLTREQLIDEVIKARIETERAKKGYAVQGGGQEKEFIYLKNLNSK